MTDQPKYPFIKKSIRSGIKAPKNSAAQNTAKTIILVRLSFPRNFFLTTTPILMSLDWHLLRQEKGTRITPFAHTAHGAGTEKNRVYGFKNF
jgi:hypothetical protein